MHPMSTITREKSNWKNATPLRNVDCFKAGRNAMRDDMEWIRRTVHYRTLIGKRDNLGYPLRTDEAARLAELKQFFASVQSPELEAWAQREQSRATISVVVTFQNGTPNGGRGCARDISGDGVFVETTALLRPGTRTTIR